MPAKPAKRTPAKAATKSRARQASVGCRNGTWPIFMPGSTIRRSSAISIAPMPIAPPSRRISRASSPRWRTGRDAGATLAQAVTRYEQLDDLLGRLISYAGLIHAGNTIDPARAKFYGDVQERITDASTHLLFFTLELNRIDDAKLEAAMADPDARPLPAVARRHPQGEALPARRPRRAAVPREVDDRLFGLEPAVRRDHRDAALQGRQRNRSRSSRRSICCRTRARRRARRPRRRSPRPSRKTCGSSR